MYFTHYYCSECEKATAHINGFECAECKNKKGKAAEDQKLKEFSNLSLDEKLMYLFNKIEQIEKRFDNYIVR